jgi:hypothetical protein
MPQCGEGVILAAMQAHAVMIQNTPVASRADAGLCTSEKEPAASLIQTQNALVE